MMQKDALIFDADGVLVDVHRSYRQALKMTVAAYLRDFLAVAGPTERLIDDQMVTQFKNCGGFNNDWDLSAGVICFYLELLGLPGRAVSDTSWADVAAVASFLRRESAGHKVTVAELESRRDLQALYARLERAGCGLQALAPERFPNLLFYRGEIGHTNLVKRYFQELYLGPVAFRRFYGHEPLFSAAAGLYKLETGYLTRAALLELKQHYHLGVATGRDANDFSLLLEHLDLAGIFTAVYTETDSARDQALGLTQTRKPYPHPIWVVHQQLIGSYGGRSVYIGDQLDDMRAANRAKTKVNIQAIACLQAASPGDRMPLRELFTEIGSDHIIENVTELPGLIGRIWEISA